MTISIVRGTLALSLLAILLPSKTSANSNYRDFAAAEEALKVQQERIYALADQYGRYHPALVEPLQNLALSQLEVSRYDSAANTADYAIQIVRTRHGLQAPQQYDLQQMAVEIDLLRQDWEAVNERLDYYSTLILSHYIGSIPDRISRMLWLADLHVRGGIEDSPEKQATHMREATWLNETAVGYAEKHGMGNSRMHAEMLYSLTQKYYLEARVISEGGANSYRLRQIHPKVHRVQDKFDALESRHEAGLKTLTQLRDMFKAVPSFGAEAVAMAELYLADWNALFDASDDISASYQQAFDAFRQAGVSETRLARFLASPTAIPGSQLDLRLSEAMSPGNFTSRSRLEGDTLHRISLIEPASHLAGFTQELALVDWQGGLEEDWSRLTVRMTIDPATRITVRNGAFRTKSRVTGTDVVLDNSEAELDITERALKRIKTLSFRPAFADGKAIASTVQLDYLIRDSAQRSVTPLIAGNWVASFQAQDHGANLAAAGE